MNKGLHRHVVTEAEIQILIEFALDRDVDAFSMESDWYADYGMDSLGAVALAVELRKKYLIHLDVDQIPSLRNGNQLKRFIERHLQNPKNPPE